MSGDLDDWEPMSDKDVAIYAAIPFRERRYDAREWTLWQLAVEVRRLREVNNHAAHEIMRLRAAGNAMADVVTDVLGSGLIAWIQVPGDAAVAVWKMACREQ